jgi:signal transduction histidine kinase
MFFKPKKSREQAELSARMATFVRLSATRSPDQDDFLMGFKDVLGCLSASSGSLYVREAKSELHLLKCWEGTQPRAMSISDDYEFVTWLKREAVPAFKQAYAKDLGHEARQVALLYFQNTGADAACVLQAGDQSIGLLNVLASDHADAEALSTILQLYASQLVTHLQVQHLRIEGKKLAEIGHIKNQLLANVTHELKTPLNGIMGFAEVLLDGGVGALPAEAKSVVERIRRSAHELEGTVDGMLNLVQLEARKNEIRFQIVDLFALVRESAALFSDVMAARGLSLKGPNNPGESIRVYAEPDQIRTVLMNLLNNALKFTQKGDICLSVQRSGGVAQVSLSDTGIGIDEEKTELIFEEFYQADGSSTRVYGGTGVGLAIAKKIITLHGGRIWAESAKGRGATFVFTLPIGPH